MAQVYFPDKTKIVDVLASPPHPPNTHYRVSIGLEKWGGHNHPVAKVQMVYNGRVAGRCSPSYPLGTDDYARVGAVISDLIKTR